uniref:Uncharacterized protein n=1 Tax=Ananas comosus var. bracteatus TaxID=296719 RepID=A0A6V7PVL5_ANACO|nr:unnamed protein product [Ananas comosus var. bracteatus]
MLHPRLLPLSHHSLSLRRRRLLRQQISENRKLGPQVTDLTGSGSSGGLDLLGVVDCVPTYGTCPEECGTKPCTKIQKFGFWSALGLAVCRACTGTRLCLYRYRAANSQTRASGLHFRRSCTGTRVVLYRYNVDCCTSTAIGPVPGLICDCGLLITAPTPLGLSPGLRRVENQVGHPSPSPFGFDLILAWFLMVFPSLLPIGAIFCHSEVSNCPLGTINYSSHALFFSMFYRAFHSGRLICVDIWRVWARYQEDLRRSRGVTSAPL